MNLITPEVSNEYIFTEYEAADSRILYTGNAAKSSLYYLTHQSGMKLASSFADMYFTYTGDNFMIRGVKTVGSTMLISIDGGAYEQIDMSASSLVYGVYAYESTGLADGTHTVHIKFTSVGYIDDILINGTLVQQSTEDIDLWKNYEPTTDKAQLKLTGSWNAKGTNKFDQRNALASTKASDTMTVKFNGTKFAIVGYKSATQGKMWVSIDGAAAVEVDLYANAATYQVVTYESAKLSNGTHTVKLSFENKNASIDCLRIVGTLVNAN